LTNFSFDTHPEFGFFTLINSWMFCPFEYPVAKYLLDVLICHDEFLLFFFLDKKGNKKSRKNDPTHPHVQPTPGRRGCGTGCFFGPAHFLRCLIIDNLTFQFKTSVNFKIIRYTFHSQNN